jgi:hypothetical protein
LKFFSPLVFPALSGLMMEVKKVIGRRRVSIGDTRIF